MATADLDSAIGKEVAMSPTAERVLLAPALALLLLTSLIDPVYSASISLVLLTAYVIVAHRTRAR